MGNERRLVELMLADVNLKVQIQTDPQLVDNIGRLIDCTGAAIKVLTYAVSVSIVLVGTLVGVSLFGRYVIFTF